jgi:galactoside O-acetyltransferase
VVVGTNSVIHPEVVIGEGTSVGSMTLVNKSLAPWGVYIGIPAKRFKERNKEIILKGEEDFKEFLKQAQNK